MARRQVLLNWPAYRNASGWSLVSLNLFQQWARDADIQPLLRAPLGPENLQGNDPLRLRAIEPAAVDSNEFLAALTGAGIELRERGVLVIDALGNGLTAVDAASTGLRNVGRCIFENTRVVEPAARLAKYDSILCASNWAAGVLRALSDKPVTMIHEGIDHAQFFPGPRSGVLDPGCFYVFSGGKIEYRKAHDLVLLAFREFAARHDDAVLVAAWHSPWPQLSAGFQGRLRAPLQRNAAGTLEIVRWVVENGIDARQFIELPPMPNPLLPAVLREMDCAIQVSRCEACTNLPANEAMACGVPVILADNTGTRDLIAADNCVRVAAPDPVVPPPGWGTDGWGECRVEEIVAALETLYTDSALRRRIGSRGAQWILESRRTWRDHAEALKSHLLTLV